MGHSHPEGGAARVSRLRAAKSADVSFFAVLVEEARSSRATARRCQMPQAQVVNAAYLPLPCKLDNTHKIKNELTDTKNTE